MEHFQTNLAQINHEKSIAKYFGIPCHELQQSQKNGSLFSVRAPKHFVIGDTECYRKEEIEGFLSNFVEQPGDGL